MELFITSLTDKAQADGAQTVSLGVYDSAWNHQLQVEVSATPTGGTLKVEVKVPGASSFIEKTSLDLTSGDQLYQLNGYFEAFRFTPSGFDADKTYSVFLASGAFE